MSRFGRVRPEAPSRTSPIPGGRASRSSSAHRWDRGSVLLRNYSTRGRTGDEINQAIPKCCSPLPQTANDARFVLEVVGGGPGVTVDEAVFERTIDEDRELARRCGDSFGFADASRQPSGVGAERGLRAPETHRYHAEQRGGTIGRGLGTTTQQTPT